MPTTCGFPNCKFRSRYRGQEDNRHFYRIPKRPPQLRLRWLNAIGRTEETVVSQLRICSAHFSGGEKKEGDIPVPDPQFDPPIFINLPPRGESLRYGGSAVTAEQRQQRLISKRNKLMNKVTHGSVSEATKSFYRRCQNKAETLGANSNIAKDFTVESMSPIIDNHEGLNMRRMAMGETSGLIDSILDSNYSSLYKSTSDQQNNNFLANENSANNISSSLSSVTQPHQIQQQSQNQQIHHNFVPFLNLLGMSKGFGSGSLYHNSHQHHPQQSHHAPFHGITTTSATSSSMSATPSTVGNSAMRPLVALLDGRDCSIEMPLLKDVATVAFCDAQSTAEIHEKVLNEAVAALLYHSISLSREDLIKFKALKVVVRIGSSFHNLDVNAATELGIAICNTPAECVEETADSTILLILNMFRKTFWLSRTFQNNGRQAQNMEQLRELASGCIRIRGSTLGLIGLGRIGIAVASRARAFGFRVIFYDPHISNGIDRALGVERCDTLMDLLKRSDCISIHCPLNSGTRFMIDGDCIKAMKFGTFLVNTSASELVVASALMSALRSGHIKAAALDVYDRDSSATSTFGNIEQTMMEISQLPNVICTPNCAWYSDESSKELRTAAAKEVRRALVGRFPEDLLNCVNKEALLSRSASSSAILTGNTAMGIQELAAAAFGFCVGGNNAAMGKANLAAILNQNGSGAPGLYSSTSKTINGAHGNDGNSTKFSSGNPLNTLMMPSLNPGLTPATGAGSTDMMDQLNSFMAHFASGGSIPAEVLNNFVATTNDANSGGSGMASSINNVNYQNLLLSLNQQMLTQGLVSGTNNSNAHHQQNNLPFNIAATTAGNIYDFASTQPIAASSTGGGGGSGRSSVSQTSTSGAAFDLQTTQRSSSSAVKRKEPQQSNSPPAPPAKTATPNNRTNPSALYDASFSGVMEAKVDNDAENIQNKTLTLEGATVSSINDEKNSNSNEIKIENTERNGSPQQSRMEHLDPISKEHSNNTVVDGEC